MSKTNPIKSKVLESIPGIGPRIAQNLRQIGFREVQDLKDQDPELMYQTLCALHGQQIDRCVLYTFRCAVYYASNTRHDPERLKWWNWKAK